MFLRRGRLRTIASVACLTVLLSACATTADLYLTHERTVTGYIVDSDRDRVYVLKEAREGGLTSHESDTTDIPRSQIVSVDHPGNGLMAGGLAVTLLGIGLLQVNSDACGPLTMEIPCQASHVPLLAGIGMTLWGLWAYALSHGNYSPKSDKPAYVRPTHEDWRPTRLQR